MLRWCVQARLSGLGNGDVAAVLQQESPNEVERCCRFLLRALVKLGEVVSDEANVSRVGLFLAHCALCVFEEEIAFGPA